MFGNNSEDDKMSRQELAKFIRELRLDMFLENYEINNKLLEVEEELKYDWESDLEDSYRNGYDNGKEDNESRYEEGRADAITEIEKYLDGMR